MSEFLTKEDADRDYLKLGVAASVVLAVVIFTYPALLVTTYCHERDIKELKKKIETLAPHQPKTDPS